MVTGDGRGGVYLVYNPKSQPIITGKWRQELKTLHPRHEQEDTHAASLLLAQLSSLLRNVGPSA